MQPSSSPAANVLALLQELEQVQVRVVARLAAVHQRPLQHKASRAHAGASDEAQCNGGSDVRPDAKYGVWGRGKGAVP